MNKTVYQMVEEATRHPKSETVPRIVVNTALKEADQDILVAMLGSLYATLHLADKAFGGNQEIIDSILECGTKAYQMIDPNIKNETTH